MPQAGKDREHVADIFGNVYAHCIARMGIASGDADARPSRPTMSRNFQCWCKDSRRLFDTTCRYNNLWFKD
jgi:hypothetical protein